MRRLLLALLIAIAATAGGPASCETYEPPPRPAIEGLSSGILVDPRAPLVVDFGTPIDLATLDLTVAFTETDSEGNLPDEDSDPGTELRTIVRRHPAEGDIGARFELEPNGRFLRIVPESALPVGPQLVLLVEPGLTSTSGKRANHRQRVPFSYVVECKRGSTAAASVTFPAGYYFVLLEVASPLATQIQLLAYLEASEAGTLSGQFTNADRNPAQTCPTPCGPADACRLLPSAACVPPSTRAGTADEYPDFVPNDAPPTGYSFLVEGCASSSAETGKIGVLTAPATMVVESPKVTVEGLTMTAEFAPDATGTIRATGSLTGDVVRLGTTPLGPGKGTMTAVKLPVDRVPPGVPRPPPPRRVSDGGS